MRGLSSIGRAPDLHSGGQEFDSPRLHKENLPPATEGDFCFPVLKRDAQLLGNLLATVLD